VPVISAGILLYRRRAEEGDAAGDCEAGRDSARRGHLEVLLVHPGGPYWANRDAGSWSIPKGEAEPDELASAPPSREPWQRPPKVKPKLAASSADLLAVAKREFREETGFDPDELALKTATVAAGAGVAAASGPRYLPLGGIKQRGHKIVYAWALEGDCDVSAVVSEEFPMEWPPRSGQTRTYPEVDRAAWFGLQAAGKAIVPGQRRFLDDLAATIATPAGGTALASPPGPRPG
jgi:predicted NUDIX family NTP pyrophosphohydrolase